MGTTLTGTTPQDTYDSLIKVTDNGPLSGSLKTLTDGLGNDSALALSTGAASITGTLTTSSITRAERLQVGTAASLNTPAGTGNTLQFANYSPSDFVTGSADSYIYKNSTVFGGLAAQSLVFQTRSDTTGGGFAFVAGGTPAVVATITGSGSVGIGTSSPTRQLSISATNPQMVLKSTTTTGFSELYFGDTAADNGYIGYAHNGDYMYFGTNNSEKLRILSSGGITFNGDTAAANALDDYEEGTFTPSISFGGASVGVTLNAANAGSYTKVGRQVTVNGYLILTSKGSSVGTARITGLPFTVANTIGTYCAATLRFSNITFANQFQGFANVNTTTIEFEETTEAGVVTNITNADFANDSQVMFSLTYFTA